MELTQPRCKRCTDRLSDYLQLWIANQQRDCMFDVRLGFVEYELQHEGDRDVGWQTANAEDIDPPPVTLSSPPCGSTSA